MTVKNGAIRKNVIPRSSAILHTGRNTPISSKNDAYPLFRTNVRESGYTVPIHGGIGSCEPPY